MKVKRLNLLMFSLLVVPSVVILATRHSSGGANLVKDEQRLKVLRRKGQIHLKPTAKEMTFFQKRLQKEERELDDQIPKDLPIKIKIKPEKEKKFKDLNNENWADDFELEVTNTGTKPIYFIYILLITDVKAAAGYRIVFPLYFGRPELGKVGALPTSEDPSIEGRESYSLRIHTGQLEAWKLMNQREGRPHPKRIEAKFQKLFFGDGTGYGPGGIPLPSAWKDRDRIGACVGNYGVGCFL